MFLIKKKDHINLNMNKKYTSNIPHDMHLKNCKIHPTDQ